VTGKVLLVDVREPVDFAVEQIAGTPQFAASSFEPAALPTDSSRKVVFYCGNGEQSLIVAESYLAAGYINAAHMAGGLAAWTAAALPVIAAYATSSTETAADEPRTPVSDRPQRRD
jgi:rhodanese-related sulfurtransferase